MSAREIKHLTAEQHVILRRLLTHMARLGLTVRAFHAKHLAVHFSYSVWNRLLRDSYAGDVNKALEKCARVANELDLLEKATASARPEGVDLLPLSHVTACEASVEMCAQNIEKKRITVLLGETGAGKSELAKHLVNGMGRDRALFPGGAVFVEATPSWKTYKSCLHDIAKAVGLSGPWRDTQNVQDEVIGELRRRGKTLIAIDECQYFSAKSADVLKVLVNDTPAVLFIASEPVLWEEMKKRSWGATSQIVNRCRAVVRVTGISPDDVKPFLAQFEIPKAELHKIASEIAESATTFARFDRIRDVIFWMGKAHGHVWTLENVKNAIHLTEKNLGLVE